MLCLRSEELLGSRVLELVHRLLVHVEQSRGILLYHLVELRLGCKQLQE